MSSWHEFIFILTFVMHFTGEFCQMVEDFSGETSVFVTEGECAVDTFAVEQYKKYPNITEPHGSKGSFLRIDKSGCMITRPLALEPGSQFIMIYLMVVPGIELQVIIGDQAFTPDTTFTSWGNFIKKIDTVTSNKQVKITAQALHGKPLLIIDNFRITPPLQKFTTLVPFPKHQPTSTPKTAEKLAKVKPMPKASLVDIFREKTTEKNSQAISTEISKESNSRGISNGIFKDTKSREISTEIPKEGTSWEISTGISKDSKNRKTSTGIFKERTSQAMSSEQNELKSIKLLIKKIMQKPTSIVVFKQRKDRERDVADTDEEFDGKIKKYRIKDEKDTARQKPPYMTRGDEENTSPKIFYSENEFIDETTGTSVAFWTNLAIASLLLVLLLLILIIFMNIFLVRSNCV